MKDILLKNNDIELVDGDMPLVDGGDRIIQHINTGLKILPFEWVLDYRIGVDYINGLRAYPQIMFAQIKKSIKNVFGVSNVLNFKTKKINNQYNISAVVKSGNSEIPFTTTLSSEDYNL